MSTSWCTVTVHVLVKKLHWYLLEVIRFEYNSSGGLVPFSCVVYVCGEERMAAVLRLAEKACKGTLG